MASIVRFPPRSARPGKPRQQAAEKEAEIILFPGVRYEYLDADDQGGKDATEAREHG